MIKRVFLIVLDSFGVGNAPDAVQYGDDGANTLLSISKSSHFNTPTLKKLGMFNIEGVDIGNKENNILGSYGRLREASKGKDTTIGHWEIAGVESDTPLPTYPDGFPDEIMSQFEKLVNRKAICNKPYSGTQLLDDYGKEHVETGAYIVYTSADSVFQVAAHEDVVPIEKLYEDCQIARDLLKDEHAVARVIARPFIGEFPNFKRTSNRRDFSLVPPRPTILDLLVDNNLETIGVGKIYDIFAGKGIQTKYKTKNNMDGMDKTIALAKEDFTGLCFVNLVDFDMVYGHRRDVDGYAKAAAEFDARLVTLMETIGPDDVIMITADHGCDPNYSGTDHTREHVPFIAYGAQIKKGYDLKTRNSFSDIAATIAEIFKLTKNFDGISFLKDIQI